MIVQLKSIELSWMLSALELLWINVNIVKVFKEINSGVIASATNQPWNVAAKN